MQFSFTFEDDPPLARIRKRLLDIFGPQRELLDNDPMQQLVNAMVSSRTRDEVSLRAFRRLMHSYSSWHLLDHAPPREIEMIITPVTFADAKAAYIPRALRKIYTWRGEYDLHFLDELKEESAMECLTALPGVGYKIAAVTLNFSVLHKRTLPVDTHLLRIGKRMGLLHEGADYAAGYRGYMRLVPDSWDADALFELHWLLKYHGQHTCTAIAPTCGRCVLLDLCARKNVQ